MNRPHPTADDLARCRARFAAETVPGVLLTDRYRMRYLTWGSGPTVVSVHGICDDPLSFCMLFAGLVDRGFRVVAYDLPNGLDDAARLSRYSHDHFTDDLTALLDHLNLARVDLLGTSFGSTVTLRSLARHPERFRRAVLQGGFAYRTIDPVERGLSHLGRSWPWRMHQLPLRRPIMEKLDAVQFAGCPPQIYDFLQECSGRTPIKATSHRALILSALDLRPQLPSVPHPVLMIGGDRDKIVPRWCEADMEKGLPDVRRVEFSPCGHYPQYTMPAQYADQMAEFLTHSLG